MRRPNRLRASCRRRIPIRKSFGVGFEWRSSRFREIFRDGRRKTPRFASETWGTRLAAQDRCWLTICEREFVIQIGGRVLRGLRAADSTTRTVWVFSMCRPYGATLFKRTFFPPLPRWATLCRPCRDLIRQWGDWRSRGTPESRRARHAIRLRALGLRRRSDSNGFWVAFEWDADDRRCGRRSDERPHVSQTKHGALGEKGNSIY